MGCFPHKHTLVFCFCFIGLALHLWLISAVLTLPLQGTRGVVSTSLPSLACHCRCFGKRDTTFSARSISSSYPCKKWLVLPNSQTEKALDFVTCVNCQSSRKRFPFRVPMHGVCPLSLLMDPSKCTWTICPTWWEKSLAAVVVVCDSSFINSADTEEHLVTTNKRTA